MLDENNEEFNKQFWNRLQDEWKKISDGMDEQSPWLSEFSEYYDPYKVSILTNDCSLDVGKPTITLSNEYYISGVHF